MESIDGTRARTQSPCISVVMAAYNYGHYIGQAIQSVCDQSLADWELIVVDDGSTDDTAAVVSQFTRDPRIAYVRQTRRGQSAAKNVGIGLARGGLIAFLDADDAWLPRKLEKQVALFERDPELGVAYTGTTIIDAWGGVIGPQPRKMVRGHVLEEALKRTIPPFSSALVRRDVFDDVGVFDESIGLAIDYDLWLRVAARYRFDFVDEPLVLYRTGHANLSRRFAERRQLVLKTILPRFLNEYGGRRLVRRRVVAEAYADTYVNQAESLRYTAWWRSIAWNVYACAKAPWLIVTCKSLIRACMPDWAVAGARLHKARRRSALSAREL